MLSLIVVIDAARICGGEARIVVLPSAALMLPFLDSIRLRVDGLRLKWIGEPDLVAHRAALGVGFLRLGLLPRARARCVLRDEGCLYRARGHRNWSWTEG